MTVSEKLEELIRTGDLNWDNERHREAYLRSWIKGELRRDDSGDTGDTSE